MNIAFNTLSARAEAGIIKMERKKFLIITVLNNSGAPISLLQLLKNKPVSVTCELAVLGTRYRDLESEFKKITPLVKTLMRYPSKNDIINGLQRILAIPSILFIENKT